MQQDRTAQLQAQVLAAYRDGSALRIVGGDSKAFLGRACPGEPLEVAAHRGVLHYEPTELVITARAGTPLQELEALLAQHGQMLPFEPPAFTPAATLGGTIACNLSGPRRPYAGAARDHVLGVRIINGRGEVLHFGGEVMKNVAGYDVSRLMAGAMGTLGVLLEVSLKVLPAPAAEATTRSVCDHTTAIARMCQLAARPCPLSAAAYDGEALWLRMSGSASAVAQATATLVDTGGEERHDGAAFWHSLRERSHAFFGAAAPLWRLSIKPAAPPLDLPGECLVDWGGGLRWYRGDATAEQMIAAARANGGHATHYRGNDAGAVASPLDPALLRLHQRLKQAFDPKGILNPARLYPTL